MQGVRTDVPASRREALRLATEAVHRELDTLASALDLTTLVDYRRFLLANAAPLTALEIAIETAGVANMLPDWPTRSRRALLAFDLATLGAPVEPIQIDAIRSPSEQWGVLYVLEGSRLGARVVLERILCSHDARVREATAFLSAGDTRLWPSFLRELEMAEALDVQAMTRAACAAFESFRSSFEALVGRNSRSMSVA